MRRQIVFAGFAGALISLFAATLAADEVPPGRWTGTFVNLGGRNVTPPPRPAFIDVTRSPDPHWRWQPGRGELLSVTLMLGNRGWTVGDMKLDSGVLAFWAMQEDQKFTCKLALQPEKNYVGECTGDGFRVRLNLTPPQPESKGKPQPASNQ